MVALIRKDLVSLYSWTFIFFIVAFSFMMLASPKLDSVISTIVLTYLLAYKNIENDRKVNMDVILNSLPISRLQIIICKYLTFYLYLFLVILLLVVMSIVTDYLSISIRFNKFELDIVSFLVAVIVWSFNLSVYVPMSILIKSQVVQYMYYFIVLMLIPYVFSSYLSKVVSPITWLMQLDPPYLIFVVIIGFILNVISCLFLYSIYRKKDLL
jgi:ABC-2 type transport system permease protein